MKTARVTMSRSTGGDGSYISISITDDASSLRVIELEMSLADFGACVTGQGHLEAKVGRWIGENAHRVGMQREGRGQRLSGKPPFDKDKARKWVRSHPELVLSDGWELRDDGTSTQQNDSAGHHIHLVRYVEATP